MKAAYWKGGFSLLIFTASVLAITVPLVYSRFKHNNYWNSLANSFSAGVFLAIGLLHLLPEGAESLSSATGSDFPLGCLLAIASYSLVMYIEKVAFDSHKLMSHGVRHTDLGSHHKDNSDEEEERMKHELNMRNRFTQHLKLGMGDRCENLCKKGLNEALLDKTEDRVDPGITSYLLAAALSMHSLFEGMAIGIQDNDMEIFQLGLSVLIHKLPEAFALGVSLNKHPQTRSMAVITIFTIATPIGIYTSMVIINSFASIEGIVLSLSAGTFLYISASEIVVEEFSVSRHKYSKFAFFLLGVAVVSLLIYAFHD